MRHELPGRVVLVCEHEVAVLVCRPRKPRRRVVRAEVESTRTAPTNRERERSTTWTPGSNPGYAAPRSAPTDRG